METTLNIARITLFALTALVLIVPCAAGNGTSCPYTCPNAYFVDGSSFPFDEHIVNDAFIQVSSSTWVPLVTGCTTGTYAGKELRGLEAFRLIARGWVKMESATGPIGTRYELGLFVDGTQIAGATKFFKPYYDTTLPAGQRVRVLMPMYEMVAANWPDTQASVPPLSAGNHSIELKARMVDSGSITVREAGVHAQGVPSSQFDNRRTVSCCDTFITTGSFGQATPLLVIANPTGSTQQILPQAYFQYKAGTAGTKVETKFVLAEAGGSGRTFESPLMNVYVSCGSMASDGTCTSPAAAWDSQPILGPVMDVPPASTFTLKLMARASAAGVQVGSRYTDYTFVPPPSGTDNINNQYWQATRSTPITVATNTPSSPQPSAGTLQYWSDWTQILQVDVPSKGAGEYENLLASVYLDLYRDPLDANAGNWQNEQITVAIEVEKANGTYWEWGKYDLPLNKGSQSQFVFTDSMFFGIEASTGPTPPPAAKIRLFMRKGYPVQGAVSKFEVRNARMDFKRFNGDHSCYVTP
jgi:hypothetical protein